MTDTISARGAGASLTPNPTVPREPLLGGEALDHNGTHTAGGSPAPTFAAPGQLHDDTLRRPARGGEPPELIATIIETHRQRVDMMRAMQRLTLQVKAICRRFCDGDKKEAEKLFKAIAGKGEHPMADAATAWCGPILTARAYIEEPRKELVKRLAAQAGTLRVAAWVESVPGFGLPGLGAIVGEAGDLSNYANPAKLWKRMGLAVIDGERQRRVTGKAALVHGYSPGRRSIVWNIGDSMIKAQGPYRDLYLQRLGYKYQMAVQSGLTPVTANQATVDSWIKRGLPAPAKLSDKKFDPEKHRGVSHINNRAKRYMEKRLLRDLWRAWRDT